MRTIYSIIMIMSVIFIFTQCDREDLFEVINSNKFTVNTDSCTVTTDCATSGEWCDSGVCATCSATSTKDGICCSGETSGLDCCEPNVIDDGICCTNENTSSPDCGACDQYNTSDNICCQGEIPSSPDCCPTYADASSCNGNGCLWEGTYCKVKCSDFYEDYSCQEEASCTWDSYNYTCAEDCSAYNKETTCINMSCNWDMYSSICYGSCSTITEQTTCYDVGCNWDGVYCSDGAVVDCGMYGDSASCMDAGCYWYTEYCSY